MKYLNKIALLAITASILQACAGQRNSSGNAGPSGPITPSTGSASNIAAGRNTAAVPVSGSQGGIAASSTGVNPSSGLSGETGANNGTRASSSSNGSGNATQGETTATALADADSEQKKLAKAKNSPAYFIDLAAITGLSDVKLSEYALSRATTTDAKALAMMVVKERGDINTALQALATSKQISLPNPDSLGTDAEIRMKTLSATSANEFDGAYIQMMITDHESAIDIYEQGTRSKDQDVKDFAKKYLPLLRLHLKSAKSLIGG